MSKLIKNWSYLLLSDVSQAVISFFVFMFLARKLNPEGYGTLNALLALASLFSIFAMNVSANLVISREITLRPKTTAGIFMITFPIRMVSLVISILALVFYETYQGETNYGLITATAVIVIATLLWDLAETVAFGHFVTKLTTLISISASLIWLLIVILLPSKELDVNLVVWLYASVFILRGIVYLTFSYFKFVKDNNEQPVINVKSVLIMSMPYLWMRVVGTFSEQIPILLLKGYSGAAEVGYYAVGSRFVMPITLAVTTGLRAVFPFMTKLFHEDKEKFRAKLVEGFTFVFIIGSTIAVGLTISSGVWLPLFFGDAYQDAIKPFNYQAWFGILLCFDLLLSTVLSSTYKQRTLAIITTFDVFIVFPLLYFGTQYGAEGMAIAKLAGAIITVFYHIIVVIFLLKIKLNSKPFILSTAYFAILLITSIFITLMSVKLLVISLVLLFYTISRSSPLRTLGVMAYVKFREHYKLKEL